MKEYKFKITFLRKPSKIIIVKANSFDIALKRMGKKLLKNYGTNVENLWIKIEVREVRHG